MSDRRTALILFLVAFVVYNLNGRVIGAGDTRPASFLPFALLEHGTLNLDSVARATALGRPDPYWIIRTPDGHLASMYPVVTPLLVAPLYVPAWLILDARGWTDERLANAAMLMEKLSASSIAALCVALMYVLLRRRLPRRDALVLAALFAFGTNTWVTSSQALWQHGLGELLVIVALLAATGLPMWTNVVLLGLAIGLLPANRPPDIALALGFAVHALPWARRRALAVAGVAALPLALVASYNISVFGTLIGGYRAGGVGTAFFAGSLFVGIAGLLFSPGKGLFVFAPFLLFLPLFLKRTLAEPTHRLLTWCLAGSIGLQLVLYAKTDWRGGESWGPRFLTDLLPVVLWMLAPIVAALSAGWRRTFLALGALAVVVQAIGAFCYQGRSDYLLYHGPGRDTSRAWRLENTPYWADPQWGLAPMSLLGLFDVSPKMQYPGNWLRALGLRADRSEPAIP